MTEPVHKGAKVVVVGTGMVGASFAYTAVMKGLISELVLIDLDRDRAEGEAMDLNHSLPFASPMKIYAGDYPDCADAQIIVICAGAPQKPGQTRLDLAKTNTQIMKDIVQRITRYNNDTILLVASNPVDVLTYAAIEYSGFSPRRVIGSGTILDTARLRYLIAEQMGLDPRSVHAYVIGEHGDSELVVWSSANIAGIRIQDFCPVCRSYYNGPILEEIFHNVRNAAYEIIKRKKATYYGIAMGLHRIVESILLDQGSVWTVSTLVNDYYGVDDVCLGMPAVINSTGIDKILRIPLNEEEEKLFKASAEIVKEVTYGALGRSQERTNGTLDSYVLDNPRADQ